MKLLFTLSTYLFLSNLSAQTASQQDRFNFIRMVKTIPRIYADPSDKTLLTELPTTEPALTEKLFAVSTLQSKNNKLITTTYEKRKTAKSKSYYISTLL